MKEKDCNKKRTYGLGHVRQRKDGSFEGILYDKRIGRTVSVSAKTQTELNKRMNEGRKKGDFDTGVWKNHQYESGRLLPILAVNFYGYHSKMHHLRQA